MKIIDYPSIREKYHQGFPRENPPTEIVIHGTGGGASAQGVLNWMFSPGGRVAEYKRGIALFHAMIDVNGDIYQIINNDKWVYHSSSGEHDKQTIGIECVNLVHLNNGDITANQYGSLFAYINLMMAKYPITSIVGHDYNNLKFSNMKKGCPGPFFQWPALEDFMLGCGYLFDYEDMHLYNIHRVAGEV